MGIVFFGADKFIRSKEEFFTADPFAQRDYRWGR
jgi:hypothetical protein